MKKWKIATLLLILVGLFSCRKEEIPIEYLSPEEADKIPRTGLPVVIINAPNLKTYKAPKTIWYDASVTIVNPDLSIDLRATAQIKGRGNSSWDHFPKKSFSLKLDEKAEVLGMSRHRRWCLISTWLDRTRIRHAVAYEIARHCPGLDWTPSGQFVEVILNGAHKGNYYLCEQIRVSKNRVNISKLDPNVTSGDSLTGGYLMELDNNLGEDDEPHYFRSAILNIPWNFKDPDEVNQAQIDYMTTYVYEMELSLFNTTLFNERKFTEYMDLESFADLWMVNELTMNKEIIQPRSLYMHKDINGLMVAGPAWDFDWETFRRDRVDQFIVKETYYFKRLFRDAEFRALVKRKWQAQKPDFENILYYIDQLHEQLAASEEINGPMWPITMNQDQDNKMTFDEAIENMKQIYSDRIKWLDSQISNF